MAAVQEQTALPGIGAVARQPLRVHRGEQTILSSADDAYLSFIAGHPRQDPQRRASPASVDHGFRHSGKFRFRHRVELGVSADRPRVAINGRLTGDRYTLNRSPIGSGRYHASGSSSSRRWEKANSAKWCAHPSLPSPEFQVIDTARHFFIKMFRFGVASGRTMYTPNLVT